jgi:polar amino acid transport system permease protein
MLQLFIVYYLPGMISKAGTNFWGTLDNSFYFDYGIKNGGSFLATVVAFAFNYACYFSEIFRGGIEGIPQGQIEAGQVLGMTNRQIFFKITFMQVVKRILAPMSNEIITLVKDTALARVIGVVEMFTRAKQIAVAPDSPGIVTLFVAGVFYYVFNFIVAWVMERIEKRLNYYQ